MQLDQLVQTIDDAFGEVLPFASNPLDDGDIEALQRVFGDQGYQDYLQDQINRQIIRDYLTNAVLLGFLPESRLRELDSLIKTPENRASLSLHMLMTSVEGAADLLSRGVPPQLKQLKPTPGSPPHIHLVHS